MRSAENLRKKLYSLLGDLPDRDRPVSAECIETIEWDGYIVEKLLLDLNGIEPVPAYCARPADRSGPSPVVLYNHAHGQRWDIGKEELLLGRDSLKKPPYGKALTSRGYLVLCIDAWNFGERRGRSETELFKETLWNGQVLWGMMVYDSLKALDYLVTRPDVNPTRIATLGFSMGSTMAFWVAALDERVKVCIDLCCMTDFQSLIDTQGLDGHGIYYYVPGLLKHFDTTSINRLIAPRPHLSINGNFDRLTPPRGLDKIDQELKRTYKDLGIPEGWCMLRYNTGHLETAHGRNAVLSWLNRWL